MIESRIRRILPGAPATSQAAADAPARRFDYAALARRARARQTHAGYPDAAPATTEDEAERQPMQTLLRREQSDDEGHADGTNDVDNQAAASQHAALVEQVSSGSVPVVDAIFRREGRFLELATSLANEVAAFCADPAVGASGNWDVRMPIDQTILADTTLYLSLSPFQLSLRFDTANIESKTLLLHHSTMLEREIGSLLQAWSAPRDIELVVW